MKILKVLAIWMLMVASALATQTVYLKSTSSTVSGYNIVDEGHGTSGAAVAATATLTASGTLIQAGTTLKWITPPLASTVTIAGTITVNIWAKESATTSNAGIQVRLFRYTAGAEAGTPFATCSFGTELTTTMAAKNYTCTPTSQAFSIGDSIVVKAFFVNCATSGCPTGTMAAGTGTVDYDRSTAADGETFLTFTETPAFSQSFSASTTVSTQADLTAQFDIATSGFGPSITSAMNVSTFTQSSGSTSYNFTPALSATNAFSNQLATQWNLAAAVTSAMSVTSFAFTPGGGGGGTSFNFAPTFAFTVQADFQGQFDLSNADLRPTLTVGASVTTFSQGTSGGSLNPTLAVTTAAGVAYDASNSVAGDTVTTAMTVSQFAKSLNLAASMSVGTAEVSQLATKWSVPTSVTNSMTASNTIGESTTANFTAAAGSQLGSQWNIPVGLTSTNTVNQATTWSIAASVTAAMAVTQFTQNAGSGNAFNFNPSLSSTSAMLANLATLNNQSSAAVNSSASSQFGTSWNTTAAASVAVVGKLAETVQAIASVSDVMIERSGISTTIVQTASIGMTAQFSVRRAGQHRRRIVIL